MFGAVKVIIKILVTCTKMRKPFLVLVIVKIFMQTVKEHLSVLLSRIHDVLYTIV